MVSLLQQEALPGWVGLVYTAQWPAYKNKRDIDLEPEINACPFIPARRVRKAGSVTGSQFPITRVREREEEGLVKELGGGEKGEMKDTTPNHRRNLCLPLSLSIPPSISLNLCLSPSPFLTLVLSLSTMCGVSLYY